MLEHACRTDGAAKPGWQSTDTGSERLAPEWDLVLYKGDADSDPPEFHASF